MYGVSRWRAFWLENGSGRWNWVYDADKAVESETISKNSVQNATRAS